MRRTKRSSLAPDDIVLALAALLFVSVLLPACRPDAPSPAGPPLPRVWTLGPASVDLDEPKIEIVVEADGSVSIAGEVYDADRLKERLYLFAEASRDLSTPSWSGEGFVVIRCHRDLPWGTVQRVLSAPGDAAVRLYRVLFAVTPVGGGPEGTFALFLGREMGHFGMRSDPGDRGHVVELVQRNVEPAPPTALTAALARLGDSFEDVGFRLTAWSDVPVEYVLRVADVLVRGGVREITAYDPPLAWSKSRFAGVRPGIRLDGIEADGSGRSETEPEVTRSPDIAGATNPPALRHNWYDLVTVPGLPEGPRGGRIRHLLAALAECQSEDGSWRDGDLGLTGLALTAFLVNGATKRHLLWRETVRTGLEFLCGAQGQDGSFPGNELDHALATAALVAAVLAESSPHYAARADDALSVAARRDFSGSAAAWMEWARASARRLPRPQGPETRPEGWVRSGLDDEDALAIAILEGTANEDEVAIERRVLTSRSGLRFSPRSLALSALILGAESP